MGQIDISLMCLYDSELNWNSTNSNKKMFSSYHGECQNRCESRTTRTVGPVAHQCPTNGTKSYYCSRFDSIGYWIGCPEGRRTKIIKEEK
ncbi:hypothetical protein BLOT_000200 [Blomia tropicalis]|nr:hypothetical protein BLOT_000200 [Blomia tropicalis]